MTTPLPFLPTLGTYPLTDYVRLPRSPHQWVVEGLLPMGGWMNMYADPKVGKSYAIMQLLTGIATEEPEWLGFPLHAHGPVLYLQLDTPRGEWAARAEYLIQQGHDLSRFYTMDKESVPYPFDILDPVHLGWFRDQVAAIRPVVVVIDTLRECFKGDENDSSIGQAVIAHLDVAIRPAAGILISHSRKGFTGVAGGKGAPSPVESVIHDMRGSSYINGRMDTIIKLSKARMKYEGRSVAPATVKLKRRGDYYWELDADEVEQHIKALLADPSFDSIKGRARTLAERTGLTVEACRKRLQRGVVH